MYALVLGLSVALFLISALLEDAITLAVIGALEGIQPNFIRKPAADRSFATGAIGLSAILLSAVGVLFAGAAPDGIGRLAVQTGIAAQARNLLSTPLRGYELGLLQSGWLSKASAGLVGVALIYGTCVWIGRVVAR